MNHSCDLKSMGDRSTECNVRDVPNIEGNDNRHCDELTESEGGKLERLVKEIPCLFPGKSEDSNREGCNTSDIQENSIGSLFNILSTETTYLALEFKMSEDGSRFELIVTTDPTQTRPDEHQQDCVIRIPAISPSKLSKWSPSNCPPHTMDSFHPTRGSSTELCFRVLSLIAFLSKSVSELELVGFRTPQPWKEDNRGQQIFACSEDWGGLEPDQEGESLNRSAPDARRIAEEQDLSLNSDHGMILDSNEGANHVSNDCKKDKVQTDIFQVISIEDVFRAFAGEKSSSWRTKRLKIVRVRNCEMWLDDSICFAENQFPEGLEEVYIHDPKQNRVSSTIFYVASRSPKLRLLYTFDKHNCQKERRFSCHLTSGAIHSLSEILSRKNELFGMQQLPYRELFFLPETTIRMLLRATTIHRTAGMLHHKSSYFLATEILSNRATGTSLESVDLVSKRSVRDRLLSMMQPRTKKDRSRSISSPKRKDLFDIRNCTIRSSAFNFSLVLKRSLEVLLSSKENMDNRSIGLSKIAPAVLARCQTKAFSLLMFGRETDLLFSVLLESLSDILSCRNL